MTTLCILGCLLLALSTQGLFFKSKVCYDELGCFMNAEPFNNALDELPESPEAVNATLNLFTRKNPTTSQLLRYQDKTTISNSNYNPSIPTKILVHGFLSNGHQEYMIQLTKTFLEIDDMNIIVVDWSDGAHKFYPKAVANTRLVGAIVATFVNLVKNSYQADPASFHVIGHSLGAQVAGYIGSGVKNMGRITGLDPAGPLFDRTNNEVHLDATDATFVDCIHSDGLPLYDLGLGTSEAWGNIDFYPNGGGNQPGCPLPAEGAAKDIFALHFSELTSDVSCSHHRSILYFIESLQNTTCQMTAHPCSSYDDYVKGKCNSCGDGPCPVLGYDSIKSHREGKFYLTTNSQSPYCQNIY
ncbi:hypothetical protein SNE40_004650 [Patella caerulea]|uniref:Lipase domain-containing protein n=1 Tax=Patella caerulea TaxID=87958 RepID=A0AAN8PXF6_PATCE